MMPPLIAPAVSSPVYYTKDEKLQHISDFLMSQLEDGDAGSAPPAPGADGGGASADLEMGLGGSPPGEPVPLVKSKPKNGKRKNRTQSAPLGKREDAEDLAQAAGQGRDLGEVEDVDAEWQLI